MGTLDTNQGRPELIAYNWGRQPGPSVFPRSRWNKKHTERLCSHKQFVECFNTFGAEPCTPECGFVNGVDDKPQLLVAEAFKERAAIKDPQHPLALLVWRAKTPRNRQEDGMKKFPLTLARNAGRDR